MNTAIRVICNNKKAYHDFFISDTFEAGIQLLGSEVKSIRDGGVSINDCFVQIKNGEVIAKNIYVKPYEKTKSFAPDSRRDRKLLLHKLEINKLFKKVSVKGFSIVPTKLYFKNGLVKLEIAVAKGKKLYDKREAIAEKTMQRQLQRDLKLR